MSDEYSADCERKSASGMEVRLYAGDRPGTGQAGQTRQAGVVARGDTNERAASLATFRGQESLRRANKR
jgi:hypothetical protein